MRWMTAVLVVALGGWLAPDAGAMETRCTTMDTDCLCSEPLQSTTYTDLGSGFANGDTAETKPCAYWDGPTRRLNYAFGATGTFAGDMAVGSNSTVLAALPNRTASMARYLRPKYDLFGTGNPSTIRLGYSNIDLTTRGIKRLSLRWYRYQSSDYEWAQMYHSAPNDTSKKCTNGKIVYQNSSYYQNPTLTWQSYGDMVGGPYNFSSAGGWHHGAYSSFEGMSAWIPTAGSAPIELTSTRGKWARYETIVRRPRKVDSDASGFDVELWIKNVTDGGANNQVAKFSAGCTGCMTLNGVSGQNFVWGTGSHPNVDMQDLHIEDYRASDTTQTPEADGKCYGWQAYAYVMMAAWTTDNGTEFIGAANEVEGTGSAPIGTPTLSVSSFIPILLTIGLGVLATICMILGLAARAARRHDARHPETRADGGSDLLEQPVGPRPVDRPRAPAQPAPERVALAPRTDELVGGAGEMEGPVGARERDRQAAVTIGTRR